MTDQSIIEESSSSEDLWYIGDAISKLRRFIHYKFVYPHILLEDLRKKPSIYFLLYNRWTLAQNAKPLQQSQIIDELNRIFKRIRKSPSKLMHYSPLSLSNLFFQIQEFQDITRHIQHSYASNQTTCVDTFLKLTEHLVKIVNIKSSDKYEKFRNLSIMSKSGLKDNSEDQCPICLDVKLSEVDYMMLDACPHLFCQPCAKTWFTGSRR